MSRLSLYAYLCLPDGVKVSSFVEDISVHQEEFYQVLSDVPASDVQPLGDAGDGEAVVDRHDMGHTVTRVNHDTYNTLGVN